MLQIEKYAVLLQRIFGENYSLILLKYNKVCFSSILVLRFGFRLINYTPALYYLAFFLYHFSLYNKRNPITISIYPINFGFLLSVANKLKSIQLIDGI